MLSPGTCHGEKNHTNVPKRRMAPEGTVTVDTKMRTFCSIAHMSKMKLLPTRYCCTIFARRANLAASALLNPVHVRLDLSIVHESSGSCRVYSTAVSKMRTFCSIAHMCHKEAPRTFIMSTELQVRICNTTANGRDKSELPAATLLTTKTTKGHSHYRRHDAR